MPLTGPSASNSNDRQAGAFAGPSVWQGSDGEPTRYPTLQESLDCDVLIVGAGITGLTLALALLKRGKSVVMLEAWQVGSGTTGHSTGNLYECTSQSLAVLAERWGDTVARAVVSARRAAISRVTQTVAEHATACNFRRCSHYQFATDDNARREIDAQEQVLTRAGSNALLHDKAEALPLKLMTAPVPGSVLELPDQAQFHPLAYVKGLAAEVTRRGGRLFEHSKVDKLDYPHRSALTLRGTVHAGQLVLATHTPKGFHPVQAEMLVQREYAVALPVTASAPGREAESSLPPGVFWARGDLSMSLRGLETAQGHYLICIGPEHSTGDHDTRHARAQLAHRLQGLLGRKPSEARLAWAAQNYRPADGLPYVGQDLSGCWIATGFATDGLVWGTVAAEVLAEQLTGQHHALAKLLRPGRFTPMKGAKVLLQENFTVARALVKDYLLKPAPPAPSTPSAPSAPSAPSVHPADSSAEAQAALPANDTLPSLPPGEAMIVRAGAQQVAAYRALDGTLNTVSPVCPHMKCKVRWNSAEASWDCPCHGSRFQPDGEVIEGPAIEGLAKVEISVQAEAAVPKG
jgi:glycine/D-amino acid oxidase-like deaminating enzyme/Rieske Fe-S protein